MDLRKILTSTTRVGITSKFRVLDSHAEILVLNPVAGF